MPINWLNVVRFHKDIVERSEDNVYALDIWEQAAPRWSCLDNFQINDLVGDWIISDDDLRSQAFRNEVEQERFPTIFLGGACFAKRDNANGQWIPRSWVPLIYKEVGLEQTPDGWRIIPRQDG